MVKLSKIFLLLILALNFASVSFAAVINNAPGKMTDPFITFGARIARDGIIWASLFEGDLVIEARFITRLSPGEVIKLYSSFVRADIERFSDTDPVWKWMGDVDGEEKHLTITYNRYDQVTIIELASYKKERHQSLSPFQRYPFLRDMEESLITSKETFNGEYSSALFMYEYSGTPSAAVRYVRGKLKTYGWQDASKKEDSAKSDQAFHLMEKKGEGVGIVAVMDDDRTTTLTLIFRKADTQNDRI
ncbi:MAG: hypothetical protein HQ558_03800 [Candidatus Omnitrophica bacterium]|nr:hypothetical protein [Candidatus Omnitrophota bacterium]